MAMVVQHNITAMNSNRQLGITTSGQSKSSEKLSSGYKINRAADDAAGLKISEKMRSQVRGLQRASTNAQDGVSLIQTAEGALNEVHSILQRMNELAVQGANDTNQNIDRDAIQQELNALTEEIDRVADTTQFNKQNLLNGQFTGKNLQVGANNNQKITLNIAAMNASAIGLKKGYTASVKGYWTANDITDKAADNKYKGSGSVRKAIGSHAAKGVVIKDYQKVSTGYLVEGHIAKNEASVKKFVSKLAMCTAQVFAVNSAKRTSFKKPDVSDYTHANGTIDMIARAINNVSNQRSALGALQNRLEHTIANLDNVAENTQAAESRIRDTDMASEMVEYSKNNILAQAGQSMLAQANQSNQGVLSLLQ
ncbi:MAG: flagellin [Roseburia sp.]|nr:flagellin [Roseburia sp.]